MKPEGETIGFTWKEITLAGMLAHFQGKTLAGEYEQYWMGPCPPEYRSPSGIVLSDGTAVIASSEWREPYSELTPDIDAEPPRFWIGIPSGGQIA